MKGCIQCAGHKDYKILTFSWFLTQVCQYRCDYCSVLNTLPLVKSADNRYIKSYKSVLSLLRYPTLDNFKIELQGGEPTMHPEIFSIIESLNSNRRCIFLEVITNLVKPLTFYDKFDSKKYNKLLFTTSYHPQYHEKCSYVEKIVHLSKYDHIKVEPNINISDKKEYWEDTIDVFEKLIDNNITYGVNFLFKVDHYDPTYTDEVHTTFKKYIDMSFNRDSEGNDIPYVYENTQEKYNTYFIHNNNLDKFYGYKCTPKYWVINFDGTVTNSCTGEPFDINRKTFKDEIRCPVKTGCGEVEKLLYYKYK
jgi:MoaA/NifB/PqqE/SkfB family radical SAM enzyme